MKKNVDPRTRRIGYALAIAWGGAVPFLKLGWCTLLGGSALVGITLGWLFARSLRRNSN